MFHMPHITKCPLILVMTYLTQDYYDSASQLCFRAMPYFIVRHTWSQTQLFHIMDPDKP